ncbi:M14 family zinc carboxypeptidase [Neobacillus soli]|uniref:M14 family zinc carboxypeptidase n=1 Tax=Neobacillus soli TaxID=220688 RepID=UPI000B133A53|nr:M14 family zinc carboxypeptidase [Neobacillus soli]
MRRFKISIIILILLFSGLSFTENAKAASFIVNPKQVYTYSKMVSDMKKLEHTYPNLIKVKVIGKSELGRNIYALSLGNGPSKVFINGSHHAREWMTTTLNMYMMNQYADAYLKNKKINGYNPREILSTTTIWFVPMVNPDGVTLQQMGLKAFPKSMHKSLITMNKGSKNFKRWKANIKGVDLNRQYDAGWEKIQGPKKPSYKDYKGKAPATTAETKVILKFVKDIDPEMAVSYHSTGKIMYWNYKQDTKRYKRDLVHAKKIGKMTGYRLIYTGKNPSGGGGFTDWFVSVKKRPGFTPEISKPVYESNPPLSEFPNAWKENQAVGLYVAAEGSKLFNERNYSSLQTKYKNLQSQSKKLQPYYDSNVKGQANLKIEKKFTDLYNNVKNENHKLAQQTGKLYSSYRKKLEPFQKDIKLQLGNSEKYIAGITAGEKLQSYQKAYLKPFEDGTLNANTAAQQQQLITMKSTTMNALSKMTSPKVRSLATEKYILPASITVENTMYEIKRFNLTVQIEEQLKLGDVNEINKQLFVLEQMETEAVAFKENKIKLFPGQYKFFVLTEKMLAAKKAAIAEGLDKLIVSENEKNPQEDPANLSAE